MLTLADINIPLLNGQLIMLNSANVNVFFGELAVTCKQKIVCMCHKYVWSQIQNCSVFVLARTT